MSNIYTLAKELLELGIIKFENGEYKMKKENILGVGGLE